ncbi:MAG: TetR/AcrR family transcriptional regulator [Firmicutes bacterium]|nr:TetR/AcrR family transcriptional regulator [Bacillota bacterium]
MPKKTEAQAIRSKEWMVEALICLMKEKAFAEITIAEVAKRADLDRRTFYRHFKAKEDMIRYKIRKMAEEYEALLLKDHVFTTRSILRSFFTVCEKNKALLTLFYRHNQLPLLLYELNTLCHRFHDQYTIAGTLPVHDDTGYALAYHIGGLWNILNKWLSEGARRRPAEIAFVIKDILPEFI